jgi:hypothetical protein
MIVRSWSLKESKTRNEMHGFVDAHAHRGIGCLIAVSLRQE